MKKETVRIINALGLHLRASSKLSQTATRYPCEVWISKGDKRVNAKSVLGVTMLAAGPGTDVEIETDGPMEEEAMAALKALIADRFGEGG
ncbi:MAG: HPr family phosphocarrier protein [Betaproteobacteria bacterium]|nr:HPr family phosphocarrier protein [Betaproteobacteria bacterium]NBT75029.1 HPr family phosphocarrier protein [Betaproteobacteria bacterium]NBY14316.1 HPr family phosphocarrier protein [Betaproteobacteria bacterium]NCA16024.1 HPr family phosphocarrier protein [Betaproteobacteria bacterium]NDF03691.1 HPr family phosphocarrier protein [Betaproteobacteria bacterium]